MEQLTFKWIPIDMILPNSKNPRKDNGIKNEEIKEIINDKGWEEAITCYKLNEYYVILSGHRRWTAAKALGHTELPVIITTEPKDKRDELDRLGSIQGGQIDWNSFEWAQHTYNLSKHLEPISYSELSKKLKVSTGLIAARIRVINYYPREDIESKVSNGMYSITMLDYIYTWIRKLKKYQPNLLESLTEDFVRNQLLKKYENKCFGSKISNDNIFVNSASANEIKDFIIDSSKKLSDCQLAIEKRNNKVNKDFISNSMLLTASKDEISKIRIRTQGEAKLINSELEKLLNEIDFTLNEIKSIPLED